MEYFKKLETILSIHCERKLITLIGYWVYTIEMLGKNDLIYVYSV